MERTSAADVWKMSTNIAQRRFSDFRKWIETALNHAAKTVIIRPACPSIGGRLYDGFRQHTTDVTADAAISAPTDRYAERIL